MGTLQYKIIKNLKLKKKFSLKKIATPKNLSPDTTASSVPTLTQH